MSPFNPFKKKEQPSPSPQPYLGDLAKTNAIVQLAKIPPAERDENWKESLLANLASASFRCGDPQVITGPDGFPYVQLFLPEPNTSFQCYVIDRMKDDFLLTRGFGIVINPTPTGALWVLTNGDILNLYLHQIFYTTEKTPFSKETTDETITENEEVMIGQPSDSILPDSTRKLLREYLNINGIKNPKVLLMMRHAKNDSDISQDIVFNLTPKDFDNQNLYRDVMQSISWYLPRHYSFVGMDEKTLGNGFMPL
jgi:hypothetical protein